MYHHLISCTIIELGINTLLICVLFNRRSEKSQHLKSLKTPVEVWSSAVFAKKIIGPPTAPTKIPWGHFATRWPVPPTRQRVMPPMALTERLKRPALVPPQPQGLVERVESTSHQTSEQEDVANPCQTGKEVRTIYNVLPFESADSSKPAQHLPF